MSMIVLNISQIITDGVKKYYSIIKKTLFNLNSLFFILITGKFSVNRDQTILKIGTKVQIADFHR